MTGQSMILDKTTERNITGFKLPSVDSFVLATVIFILNLHLMGIGDLRSCLFYPSAVISGEWWRVFTHPFAHVSVYHLVFDAGSFFVLYSCLNTIKAAERLFYVLVSGIFSLLAVCLFSAQVDSIGFCGLSGIDHGLFVVMALFMIREKKTGKYKYTCLALVTAKCVFELVAGGSYFSFLHFGQCGTPLVACHFGGAMGGFLAFFLIRGV